ncbi:MAG: 4Fe-4S ferredoxin [Methanobacteriaceae archaeon]|nr:4Fe-4S ferredoxin [Methanobacteriaceae archaeon]MDP2836757.1 4Fe-4S ferredoxin [Methanobacteriaceae archaeon]MDP3034929.1 4Fe-4S ferredoxin [Methanobacteriaceae archaeon]MDP3485357.1 4Fe-4S ferredoxin [Methanobacteriaceae archaeon]MDP3622538.1 4Fe-4S ferredoxin [Methanobacteriaceae archaeon]
MQFENLARKTIENECEDYYFGIADLSTVQKSETQKYGSLLDAYPNAISIGLTIFPKISHKSHQSEYEKIYNDTKKVTDGKLDIITANLSELLQKNAYAAFPVPKIETNEKLFLYLHKMAAKMAGLDRIEKDSPNRTLNGDNYVNWGTVLTNAPL